MDRPLAFRPGAHCAPTERDRDRINGTYGQRAPLARDPKEKVSTRTVPADTQLPTEIINIRSIMPIGEEIPYYLFLICHPIWI